MTDTSQHGESSYLRTLFPENYKGVCVEVGAYDGISASNTYLFEKNLNWKCMCIEPIPDKFLLCKNIRELALNYAVSNENKENIEFTIFNINEQNTSAISGLCTDNRLVESHKHMINNVNTIKVSCKTLTTLLDEYNYPTEIDIVSIDTENTELDVLKGIDFNKYKIKIFVIENNFNEPYHEEYLKNYGYKKINRIAVNDFYSSLNYDFHL